VKRRQWVRSQEAMQEIGKLLEGKVDPSLVDLGAVKVAEFLAHVGSSAPRPLPPDGESVARWQDRVIEEMIEPGSSVLDLGCGNGELLARLMERKEVRGQGVELDPRMVVESVARGVPVLQMDVDAGLQGFAEDSFDYIVLEETLQTLRRPRRVLEEMLRVGRYGVVSFPNFAYWRVRLELVMRGRMPVTEWLPYRWHETPNIHLLSLQDFFDWCDEAGVRVRGGQVLAEGRVRELHETDNLYAEEALVLFEGTAEQKEE
jgi:methionine biosynthesis protein MetW